jgi:hypothetical protein
MLNIIMYHYVRNNEDYSYDCYCRRFSEFESQISFLSSKFEFISPGDIEKIRYYLRRDDESACLLTFDDGYKDHFLCSKLLASNSLCGIFFPPINAVKGELLDVNAIHYLIGERSISTDELLKDISRQVKEKGLKINSFKRLPISIEDYLNQDVEIKHDDTSTVFVKLLLQRDIIGESTRRDVIHECLKSFSDITISEHAKHLYLSVEDMQQMRLDGMYFGSHGLTHQWLNTLSVDDQYIEITKSFEELEKIGLFSEIHDPKVMCYPYGAYDSHTVDILINQNVTYSMIDNGGAATGSGRSSDRDMHHLKRWDTNDFWNNQWRKPCMPFRI